MAGLPARKYKSGHAARTVNAETIFSRSPARCAVPDVFLHNSDCRGMDVVDALMRVIVSNKSVNAV